MSKSFHVIFCHPMDHYKFMRNIKQHLSLLLDEPAEKQMIRNLPHRFSSLYSFFFFSLFYFFGYIFDSDTHSNICHIIFAVTNCSLNMYNKDERVMLGACVSAELKENENEDRVKIDRNNNLSICLDNVKRKKVFLYSR